MKHVFLAPLLTLCTLTASAQAKDDYDSFSRSLHDDYNSFLSEAKNDYASFRRKINNEYAAFLADTNWVPAKPAKPQPKVTPRDNSLPPAVVPYQSAPIKNNTPLPIEEVIIPTPIPEQPRPLAPIEHNPLPGECLNASVRLYGTDFTVRIPRNFSVSIGTPGPASIGKAWQRLTDIHALDATIGDLLRIRTGFQLCDWAYYNLVNQLAGQMLQAGSAESALLTAYIMNQSGYATRLAYDASTAKVYAMPGTENLIFDQPYFPAGDVKFYPFATLGSVLIINADYPGSRPLSMLINRLPRLSSDKAVQKSLTSIHHPSVATCYPSNPNLMEFFDSYPASALANSKNSKWAYYAVTPLSEQVKEAVYPVLKSAIAGKSQLEAVNLLMDFCESIPYAYDNEVWGYDRAFFPDEMLYYLQGDCEDHAILLVRLVRDLLDLETALVYFPNHLATAICFTEPVNGSYIDYNHKKWTVCDPTIFYAGAGQLMNGCDISKAALIPLTGLK